MQLIFDFRRLLVVPNFWGPVYHLQYEGGLSVFDDAPIFWSIDEAIEFSRNRGKDPEVSEETHRRYSGYTPEELRRYREKCR